jgi:hypothetical protein
MFALELSIPSIESPTSSDAATQLLQGLREFAVESAEASLEEVTGDKDSKLYQLLEWPQQYPVDDETVEDAINRYFDYLQANLHTCYAGHYECVLVGFYAAKFMGFPDGTCIPVQILEYPSKKATRNTHFPSYGDAKPMHWGVSQIGGWKGTQVPPMVFSYSHVDVKNRKGHFDVVAIANETMTYSQRVRVIKKFRELRHNLKTTTIPPSPSALKRNKSSSSRSPASPSSKRRATENGNDDDDEESEPATEPEEHEEHEEPRAVETQFTLNLFFQKSGKLQPCFSGPSGHFQPRDYSETKRQVMQMLGSRANARELLKNGTRHVVLYPSEILTTRFVETNGMYGDFILLENYYKLPMAAASSPGSGVDSESIFHHAADKFLYYNDIRKVIAFASSDSLRASMEPCEVIENGERAAIMAALDENTVYDYAQGFSEITMVALVGKKTKP